MNCDEAKRISIVDYLSRRGLKPQQMKGVDFLYSSPVRREKKASFTVNRELNLWFDFGLGRGGSILDLVMLLNNSDLIEALDELEDPRISECAIIPPTMKRAKKSNLKITSLEPLQNEALIHYLLTRQISFSKAFPFVKEANYRVNCKHYFALAFANDDGGYELRNKYYQGGSSPKTISTIQGFSTRSGKPYRTI